MMMLLSTSQMSHVYSLDKNRPAITISDSTLEYVNVSKLLQVSISTSILIGMSRCKQRARAVMGRYKQSIRKLILRTLICWL